MSFSKVQSISKPKYIQISSAVCLAMKSTNRVSFEFMMLVWINYVIYNLLQKQNARMKGGEQSVSHKLYWSIRTYSKDTIVSITKKFRSYSLLILFDCKVPSGYLPFTRGLNRLNTAWARELREPKERNPWSGQPTSGFIHFQPTPSFKGTQNLSRSWLL